MNIDNENKGEKTDIQKSLANQGENEESKKPRRRRIQQQYDYIGETEDNPRNVQWWYMLAR